MNSLLLGRLVKVAPFALTAFSMLLLAHGLHVVHNGVPGGNSASNLHVISNGDDGGSSGPNLHVISNGDDGGSSGPN